jgi:hypothetical protein
VEAGFSSRNSYYRCSCTWFNFNYDVAGSYFTAANSLTVNGTTTIAATRTVFF